MQLGNKETQTIHVKQTRGFFTCLDEDGKVYDDTKYCWLQARQVWMYCRLYNEVKRFKTSEILDAARRGADFLHDRCQLDRDGFTRIPFAVTRTGSTIKVQRSLFSECFYVLAMSEMWRAGGGEEYKIAAIKMMGQIKHWCLVDTRGLGRESMMGGEDISCSMAVPMMAFCVCDQMTSCGIEWGGGGELRRWAVDKILQHIQRDGGCILENMSSTGEELPGSAGRLQIPGHAIECGWFLLKHAIKVQDKQLAEKALKYFVNKSFEQGWDTENKGLFYFLDIDGYSPTQLEWSMKLWWPLNESMIAFLMAYQHTGGGEYLQKFQDVAEYAFDKFSDKKHGGWYGYLDKYGNRSHQFKGGPWKGFFHVPRCLYMCERILEQLLQPDNTQQLL